MRFDVRRATFDSFRLVAVFWANDRSPSVSRRSLRLSGTRAKRQRSGELDLRANVEAHRHDWRHRVICMRTSSNRRPPMNGLDVMLLAVEIALDFSANVTTGQQPRHLGGSSAARTPHQGPSATQDTLPRGPRLEPSIDLPSLAEPTRCNQPGFARLRTRLPDSGRIGSEADKRPGRGVDACGAGFSAKCKKCTDGSMTGPAAKRIVCERTSSLITP